MLTSQLENKTYANEIINVSWNASDSDGDDLNYAILLSPDNGTTWKTGRQLSCSFIGLTTGTEGNSYSQDMTLWWKEEGATITHRETGKVATKYE